MNLWKAYRKTVNNNMFPFTEVSPFNLNYWKDRLFITIITYTLPLSILSLLPGLYFSIINQKYFIVAADLFIFFSLLFIAFTNKTALALKKILLIAATYLLAFVLILNVGLSGSGFIYLYTISVFSLLIFAESYRYLCSSINALICLMLGVFIYFDMGLLSGVDENSNSLATWVTLSIDLIFLSFLTATLIPKIFSNLRVTIEQQQKLKLDLIEKKDTLQSTLQTLERKNQDLELFTTIASHDLREPLRMIQSHLQLLQKKYVTQLDEKANNFIHFAVDGAKRMDNLIVDILEYSKIGAENQEKEWIDLNAFIAELVAYRLTIYGKNSPEIVVNELPKIWANKTELTILFQNLIGNALKYQMPQNIPILQIDCREEKDLYIFSIKDNGIGIKAENFESIFMLFQRLHDKNSYSGTGIGLAICKKIVEGWGGKIWVESEEGKGSTFYFDFLKKSAEEKI